MTASRTESPTAHTLLQRDAAGFLSDAECNVQFSKMKDDTSLDCMTPIRLLAVFSLAASFTGSQVSSFLVGPGINFIADDLHIGPERSWIVVSSSLATACVSPCAGYLQDLIGRRASLAFAMGAVIVGNIISATSNSFVQSLVGAAIAGIGSSIEELTAVAAVVELVPAKKRGHFLALTIGLSIGFAPAVLYAQLLSSRSDWRWIYGISLIWNVATAVGLCLSYFRMGIERVSRPQVKMTFWKFDWLGIILLTVGLTIFLVALESGGQKHSWTSAYVLVQLFVGLGSIGLLLFWESREIVKPIIPFRLFRGQRVVGLALGIGSMGGIAYYTVLNLGPTIIQTAFKESPVRYGLLALGPGLGLIVGAVAANVSLSVVGHRAREVMAIGAIIMTAFIGAEAVISPDKPATFAVISTFAAVGIGAVIIPVTTLATLACPEDLIGTAVALTVTARSVGGTIGYALLYNIYLTRSRTTVYRQIATRLSVAGLPQASIAPFIHKYVAAISAGDLRDIPLANAQILAAASAGFRWGRAEASQLVYYVSIAFGAVAIIFSLCLPNMKQYMTDKVLVRSKPQKS